jgi:hypothetical protein
MIDIPSFIPINTKKIKEYILKKYNVNISINGEFIEETLDEKYDYHIYKKGKKKNTIEFKKTNKNKNEDKIKNLKNVTFKDDIEENDENNIRDIKVENTNKEYIKKNIRYIITKSIKCRCDDKNKEIIYIKNNHKQLQYFYNFLLEKHKNTFNFFKSLTLGLKKIHKDMNNMNIDNIEHKKLIYFIEKIIPNNILINNLM